MPSFNAWKSPLSIFFYCAVVICVFVFENFRFILGAFKFSSVLSEVFRFRHLILTLLPLFRQVRECKEFNESFNKAWKVERESLSLGWRGLHFFFNFLGFQQLVKIQDLKTKMRFNTQILFKLLLWLILHYE